MGYTSIMTQDSFTCYVCGRPAADWHHVMHGSDKKLSEMAGLMVPLCRECHDKVHHVGGELDLVLKQDAQRAFIRKYLGKCYL